MIYLSEVVEMSQLTVLEKRAMDDALMDVVFVKYTATFVDHEDNKITVRGLLAVSRHIDVRDQLEVSLLRRHTLPHDGKKLIQLRVGDQIPYDKNRRQ